MSWNIYGKKLKRTLKPFEDESTRAEFFPDTFEIIIDPRQSKYDQIQSELHECLHAVVYRLSINQGALSGDLEEIIVNGVSTWLLENRKTLKKRFETLDKLATAKRSTKTK